MKGQLAILLVLLATAPAANAQIKATTADGKSVLLFPDGTWKYEPSTKAVAGGAVRSAAANQKIDFWRGKGVFFYDSAQWRMDPVEEPGRTSFQYFEGDLFGVIIAERFEMSLEALKNQALANVREIAPNAKIVKDRTVKVNGTDVLEMQISATTEHVSFVYLGYYYASRNGVVQAITYTSSNLFEEYEPIARQFLNGLTVGNI